MVAAATVAIGVAVTVAIHYATGVPMSTMVGILSGAVTNTPGLGAATQTYTDITNLDDPSISLGYAVAYPLGVIGIIGSLIFLKYAFRISPDREYAEIERRKGLKIGADRITLVVGNPSLEGRTIDEVQELADRHFVISRICGQDGKIEIAKADSVLKLSDKILVVAEPKDIDFLVAFFGKRIEMEWQKMDTALEARRVMITNPNVNGKTLGKLGLYGGFSFNITRVNRAGIDLVAHPDLQLQMGDRVTAVGTSTSLKNVEKYWGIR